MADFCGQVLSEYVGLCKYSFVVEFDIVKGSIHYFLCNASVSGGVM